MAQHIQQLKSIKFLGIHISIPYTDDGVTNHKIVANINMDILAMLYLETTVLISCRKRYNNPPPYKQRCII